MDIMKKGYLQAAICAEVFKNYPKAIKYYKLLRDTAEEDDDVPMKLQAYTQLGNNYQYMKEYKNAIKCFKKCIETAWDINDISAELDAYGSLAI